jgi:carotenoid cleavage dioxygenase-like enzyme
MTGFPETMDYAGLNAPVGEEYNLEDLTVEGTIPPDIAGTFFRAVPDPAFAPFVEDSAASLSGDGMISALRIAHGQAALAMRYVETDRHRAEAAAGRALFGKYRNMFTDLPEAAGIDRTVANTTPVWHAGRLLMTKEDGRPYRIEPATLATIGRHDFGGRLMSDTMTAHVRIDPAGGAMYFFGYESDGPCSTRVAYGVADASGELIREQAFDAPYCGMMHDFAITEHHALFPLYPTTADIDRLKAGGDHWHHELERESWLGIMPRDGDVSAMRLFRGPKGVSCYHIMNAFEDEAGLIHLDQCLSDVNAFPFIQKASGIEVDPSAMGSRLERWTVDLSSDAEAVTQSVIGPPGDFPVIRAVDQGRRYDYGWMLTMNPDMRGPPVMGGPVGAMFNLLLRLDFAAGATNSLALPPGHCFNEPVHVPSSAPGHGGWLRTIVDRQRGPDAFEHACWVIEADDVAAGPVARIAIPKRLRPQIHGWWVSAAQLAAAA